MRRAVAIAGGVTLLVFAIAAANFHFVYGSSVSGIKVLKKLSPSISETLINLDAVGNMPMIAARMQYPMFTELMTRDLRAASAPAKKPETPCSRIYPGLLQSDALKTCGTPTNTGRRSDGSETLHWADGISAVVKNGSVTEVHK